MQDVEEFVIEATKEEKEKSDKKPRPIVRNAVDLQRLKLEKLMKNPDKPVIIPEPPREKDFLQSVPSFVRNVMGSSAGAGSGEFHVYRHLRRKEYARQKFIQAKSTREQLDDDFRAKLEKNRTDAEAKTAKKREKRLKRKQKMKQRGKKPKTDIQTERIAEEASDDDNSSTNDDDNGGSGDDESKEAKQPICNAKDSSSTADNKGDVNSDESKESCSEATVEMKVMEKDKEAIAEDKTDAQEDESSRLSIQSESKDEGKNDDKTLNESETKVNEELLE